MGVHEIKCRIYSNTIQRNLPDCDDRKNLPARAQGTARHGPSADRRGSGTLMTDSLAGDNQTRDRHIGVEVPRVEKREREGESKAERREERVQGNWRRDVERAKGLGVRSLGHPHTLQ